MRLRRNFFPRRWQDGIIFIFLITIIPTVYWFEIFHVIPYFFESGSFLHIFHYLVGTFVLFNIVSNLVAVILVNTSITGHILPATLEENWKFCSVCECITPPRSHHCKICDTCILKRDHHCIFTACCIGHHNTRYFILFLFYMFVATFYMSFYNVCYLLNVVTFSWLSLFCLIFPLAMAFIRFTLTQFYIFLVLIVFFGSVFLGTMLYNQVSMMRNGVVSYESRFKKRLYDYGTDGNIKNTLGERWYLTWVSPFIKSELPHDGVHWLTTDVGKLE